MSFKGKPLVAVFFLILCSFAHISCEQGSALARMNLAVETASGGRVPLQAEIARTPAEQEKGYMNRERIPDGTGMLFVYTADRKMSFWMKNTPHPLSIAFIDSDGIIREIRDMAPFSRETITSTRSVRYALEVPAGWFVRAGISVGDRLAGAEPGTSLKALF